MPKSRLRKDRGKGKGAKAIRKTRREFNDRVRAGLAETSPDYRLMVRREFGGRNA